MNSTILRCVSLALLVSVALPGCGMSGKVDVWRFVTSGRDGWQQPEKVLEALALGSGDRVAEIGAGDGYWIPWLSAAVGPTGRVYAVEVEQEKIEELEEFVTEQGFENVEVILGEYENPLLPDGEVDLAMTSLTYHHIESREQYFRDLQDDLSSDGRVAHLDNRVGLPFPISLRTAGHCSEVEGIEREMTAAGYARAASFDFLYSQNFLVYRPAGSTE